MKHKPMLAQDYEKHGHKITYPAYVQPKLDGFRCVAIKEDNDVVLYTRSGNVINSVPHINAVLNQLLSSGDVLDGELYNHNVSFDKLSGDLRSEDGRCTQYIQYHIYDHPVVLNDRDYRQHERFQQLQQYADNGKLINPLALVETYTVKDEEHMLRGLEYYMEKGYEGVMVRCPNGTYGFGKRSNDLQKVKKFYEEEYKIVDILEGKGKLEGAVGSFVCEMEDGQTFKAKLATTEDNLKRLWQDKERCIGAQLTVKYQEKTKTGKPRFPVGKDIRWDK